MSENFIVTCNVRQIATRCKHAKCEKYEDVLKTFHMMAVKRLINSC